ncbi:GNAT family N-acetyltransferase [Alicyclobacillus fastidiosus]|uniref:GNAT family N-acetyltransferase n=1 Tax=Alicyclobacillus fastidiosus TaxID=392011 RepID=A0ABY6ZIS4_9BACL|nr:GNAT family N-acetyltransferase [Alicyclobacillus fastidiosus]WAH42774.1 GNAT family N-acetyltransferase [Alicyclobacillus fastidiosus]
MPTFPANDVLLRPLFEVPVDEVVRLYIDNRTFLKPFEPPRPDAYFTRGGQRELLDTAERLWQGGSAYTFAICRRAENDQPSSMVGRLTLSNIVRGAWHSCTVGYFVSQRCNGQGIATQALSHAVDFAFQTAELHRVQAAIMPRNKASIRVVEKVGFHCEGLAKYYLNINGIWENHAIYSVTQELWPPRSRN